MTFLQAVFSLNSIMCFFYGCVTFFDPDITVKLKLACMPRSCFLVHSLLADAEWIREDNATLLQMHGACVIGIGLFSLGAAQFEYADPR